MAIPAYLVTALENIYISPSELCNLNCVYCYTQKTSPKLTRTAITKLISKYQTYLANSGLSLKSILFCGGEVFTLPWFIPLVNSLLNQQVFITVITNGTIDHLGQINSPQNCQLIVSLDGPRQVHDLNRRKGNFTKSLAFINHALELGFPVEIFYLVTKLSYPYIDSFPKSLPQPLPITYLTDRLGSLTVDQVLNIKKNYPTYPNRRFGCFQLSLQADGKFYGCCESNQPLGNVKNSIESTVINFQKSISRCTRCPLYSHHCQGCCQPSYLCGYSQELRLKTCQRVVQCLNDSA